VPLRGVTAEHVDTAEKNRMIWAEHHLAVVLPRDAVLVVTEMVPWRKRPAASRPSYLPLPAGHPVVMAPGEVPTSDIVDYLQLPAADGGMVEGAADESLAEFRVAV
jgi:hypothetical protein